MKGRYAAQIGARPRLRARMRRRREGERRGGWGMSHFIHAAAAVVPALPGHRRGGSRGICAQCAVCVRARGHRIFRSMDMLGRTGLGCLRKFGRLGILGQSVTSERYATNQQLNSVR